MGQLKLILVAVFLTVLVNHKTFVKGQGSLQIDPYDSFEQHVRKSDEAQPKKSVISSTPTSHRKDASIQDDQTLEWRLPREVIPTNYEVKIAPVIDAGQEALVDEQWFVPGEVHISVIAQRATNSIVMHSSNITIHNVTVAQGASQIPVTSFNATTNFHDFLIINLGSSLQQGQSYLISIHFRSYITEDLNGLYRSSYVDPATGNRVWLATTQMEALHARQMMPCFDESALKATFTFTIGRMSKYIALFNTELSATAPGPTGWVWDSFVPTVKMSTYLLALIISEFTYEQSAGNLLPGKTVRTYAPAHYINDQGGVYAAENAEKVLAYFGSYFTKDYPMSKMDSAAVPDFYFGAMENYGLNIYRETALLFFPDRTLESERWSITSIIAHELAHQWFGNLISPAWWTHIWLNEGFATYFASVGAEHTNPEFEAKKRFLNDAIQRSMEFAADPNYAHSVKIGEAEWATRNAMDWFDRMVYEQAGSLIRMVDGFLTTPILTAGLKTYLNRLEYGAAQQDDLFQDLSILAEATNKIPEHLSMKDIMDTWTLKAGFPLVRVSRASSTRVFVSQEKFTNDAGAISATNAVEDELWHIPISVATASVPNFDPEPEQWLDKEVAMTSWELNADQWIILNAGATGYYRVLYDTPLTNLIKTQLDTNHSVINPLSRSQLLDDYLSSAYQKYLNLQTSLSLTTYIGNEDEIIVWNVVLKHLRKPLNLFSGSGANYANLRNYILPKIKSALTLVGGIGAQFGEKGGMPVIRHQQFVDWVCALEDEECQNFALDHITQWSSTLNNTVPRDIQQIVYCAAVAKGTEATFQFIKERYNDAVTTSLQQSRLANGMGCTTDTGFINELLEGSITPGYFRSASHGSTILTRLAMTPIGRSEVRRFIRENAAAIKTYFGNSKPIAAVFTTIASYAGSAIELQDLETIVGEIAATIADERETIDAALNTVRANVPWMNDFADGFNSFFSANI